MNSMYPFRRTNQPLNRREMLLRSANGFGAAALVALLQQESPEPMRLRSPPRSRTSPPKPRMSSSCSWTAGRRRSTPSTPSRAGEVARQAVPDEGRADAVQQRRQHARQPVEVQAVRPERPAGQRPVPARRRRASTTWRSSARWSSNFSEHTNANYFLHTGHGQQGRPSFGAWVTYGLGSECRDLPGLRRARQRHDPARRHRLLRQRLPAGRVPGLALPQRRAPGRGHHPARRRERQDPRRQARPAPQARRAGARRRYGDADPLDAAIANYELAFRMQTAVPELTDLSKETEETQKLYGLDDKQDRGLRPAVPDRPAAGRARRALRRVALPEPRPRPLGPALAT